MDYDIAFQVIELNILYFLSPILARKFEISMTITQFGEVAERLTNLPGANLDSVASAELAPQG